MFCWCITAKVRGKKAKIERLELLLKESRETTEFWRSECLKLEKLYGALEVEYNESREYMDIDYDREY